MSCARNWDLDPFRFAQSPVFKDEPHKVVRARGEEELERGFGKSESRMIFDEELFISVTPSLTHKFFVGGRSHWLDRDGPDKWGAVGLRRGIRADGG
jgi:hypothetical protein